MNGPRDILHGPDSTNAGGPTRLPLKLFQNAIFARTSPAALPQVVPLVDPADLVRRADAILGRYRPGAGPARPAFLPVQRVTLGDGTGCHLPIRYFDARCLIAAFSCDPSKASAALVGTGLQAVLRADGRASVLYGCFEYRDSDLGPYNEVGLSILAEVPGTGVSALYVAHLPVTTPLTNRAGREIWGYNKFVATILIEGEAGTFCSALGDGGNRQIARLRGGMGEHAPAPPVDLPTFSLKDGMVLETRIEVLTPFQVGKGDGFRLEVGNSSHPMTETLRVLGLDGAAPELVQYADPFQALLFPGRVV